MSCTLHPLLCCDQNFKPPGRPAEDMTTSSAVQSTTFNESDFQALIHTCAENQEKIRQLSHEIQTLKESSPRPSKRLKLGNFCHLKHLFLQNEYEDIQFAGKGPQVVRLEDIPDYQGTGKMKQHHGCVMRAGLI